AVAGAVAIAVVAADIALAWWDPFLMSLEGRGALTVFGLAAQFRLVDGDLSSVGLRLTPTQGWWYWLWAALLLGLAVLVCFAVGVGTWVLAGGKMPVYSTQPADIGTAFLRMCLFTPVQEEAIYRFVLCVPLAVLLRPWGAIAASGVAFAGLHLAYGNPSPENMVGGFLLAWAFLKSES